MALPTRLQREATEAFQNDAALMDRQARAKFGMSAKELDTAVRVLMSISQGEKPSQTLMPQIYAAARQRYGFDKARTDQEIRKAISQPDAESRINSYLSANGQSRVSQQEYAIAKEFTEHALRADMQLSIEDRLAKGEGNNGRKMRDNFEGMTASKRVIDSTRDQNDIRNLLRIQMGEGLKPRTLGDKRQAVQTARNQLADRIEVNAYRHAENKTEPSLKESLTESYDLAALSSASEDVGLSDFVTDAKDEFADNHLADDFDVTESIRD